MKLFVPQELKHLSNKFEQPIYMVGGSVRNQFLLEEKNSILETDIDIASSITTDEFLNGVDKNEYSIATIHKTLGTIVIKHKQSGNVFEHTTFRTENYANGGIHTPKNVNFTDDIVLDAKRRDFKINAIYYDVRNDCIVDPLNGMQDIKNKIISTVIAPNEVFCHDGLRILRLVRFAATLGFNIKEDAYMAAKNNISLLKDISKERIRDEFDKIIKADTFYPALTYGQHAHYKGFMLLDDIGAFKYIIPILETLHGVEQRKDYHKFDVFGHIAETFKHSTPRIRLSAILHDVAKLIMRQRTGRMSGHDAEGEKLTYEILGQAGLKYPNAIIKETARLVRLHMIDLSCEMREAKVRRAIVKNIDIFDKLMELKQADYLGGGLFDGTCKTVIRWKTLLSNMKEENVPFTIGELAIKSIDLISLGIDPKKIGSIMKHLQDRAIISPLKNIEKENQLAYVKNKLHLLTK